MEIRGITPFQADDQYVTPSRFLIAKLLDRLPVMAQAQMDQLQDRLTELSTKPVRFKFSPLVIHKLMPIEKAAGTRMKIKPTDKDKQEDKFSDPLRPDESMAEDNFFWIRWKVYIERDEKDEQETPNPQAEPAPTPLKRGRSPRRNGPN